MQVPSPFEKASSHFEKSGATTSPKHSALEKSAVKSILKTGVEEPKMVKAPATSAGEKPKSSAAVPSAPTAPISTPKVRLPSPKGPVKTALMPAISKKTKTFGKMGKSPVGAVGKMGKGDQLIDIYKMR